MTHRGQPVDEMPQAEADYDRPVKQGGDLFASGEGSTKTGRPVWPPEWFLARVPTPATAEQERAARGIERTLGRVDRLIGPLYSLHPRSLMTRWAGVETSLKMPVEGKPAVCLLDSGARCNECTPQFVVDRDLQYLPLEYVSWVPKDFMMVGLGGHMTRPLGVTVLEVDSPGISKGGKQDHIIFVVNDPSPYRQRVPVILGSNYLKYMVEATKESEGALLPPEMQEAGMAYKAWHAPPAPGPVCHGSAGPGTTAAGPHFPGQEPQHRRPANTHR